MVYPLFPFFKSFYVRSMSNNDIQTAMQGTIQVKQTSIGTVGDPYHDAKNDRVKYFSTKVYGTEAGLRDDFSDAMELKRESGATRLSMRFISEPGIELSDHPSYTEATMPLNGNYKGLQLTYLGVNDQSRTSPPEIIASEVESAKEIMSSRRQVHEVPGTYSIERLSGNASPMDIEDLVDLYGRALTSYLFSLDKKNVAAMVDNNIVYVARDGRGKIVSVAMAEKEQFMVDGRYFNISEFSEMATHPDHRSRGLVTECARRLLTSMSKGMDLIYSEARSSHPPINRALHSAGFVFSGFLNKHCIIGGEQEILERGPLENLNVWNYRWD